MSFRVSKTRIVLAVGVLILGALALLHTGGIVFTARSPDLSLRLSPYNSAALTAKALATVEGDPSPAGQRAALALAQRAIAHDATEAGALGVVALTAKDPATARRAALASQSLSRRSLRTQLWLIEDSVARGDVPGALVHYDIALRTSLSAPSILFPILVEAVGDPTLVEPIAGLLTKRPQWGPLYLQQLAQSGTSYAGISRLFRILIRRGIDPGTEAINSLYARLIVARGYEEAWELFAAQHPRARRQGVRNGVFATQGESPAPFEWQSADNAAVTVTMDRQGLTFDAAGGDGGETINQLLLLPPGGHQLAVATRRLDAPGDALPYFGITCLNGPELGRLTIPSSASSRTTMISFAVPAGCPAQRLVLVLMPTMSSAHAEGTIERVAVN